MLKRLLLSLLLLAVLAGTVFGLKYRQLQQASAVRQAPPPPVVAVTELRSETWQPYLATVGDLAAVEGITVSSEVAGVVSAIHFESGQAIRKGEPVIDLQADSDRAELRGLKALNRLAQIKFRRTAKLLPERSLSQADYDEAKATLDSTEAAVAAKQALIEKKRIIAPFDGILGIREADLGQYLAPGSPIVLLEALDPIHCDFALPERYLASLATGQTVTLAVQAYPDEIFQGRITALNPAVEVATRNLRVQATLENPDHRLRPGMFAEVRVLLPQREQVLTLPEGAITYNPYGDSVFEVLEGEQGLTVQRRQIETGESRQGRVEIRSGLSPGARVVSAGQVKLRNGVAVVLDDKPSPGERQPSS